MEKYQEQKSVIIRESIGEAIFKLLAQKNYEQIDVCQICQKAGVGRTTYYRYYGNKNGKEDALMDWLKIRWLAQDTTTNRDDAFITFLISIQKEIMLLHRHHLLHILDRLILDVFGPNQTELQQTGLYYLKYAGAGLWIGILRALIDRQFKDSKKDLIEQFQASLRQLASIS